MKNIAKVFSMAALPLMYLFSGCALPKKSSSDIWENGFKDKVTFYEKDEFPVDFMSEIKGTSAFFHFDYGSVNLYMNDLPDGRNQERRYMGDYMVDGEFPPEIQYLYEKTKNLAQQLPGGPTCAFVKLDEEDPNLNELPNGSLTYRYNKFTHKIMAMKNSGNEQIYWTAVNYVYLPKEIQKDILSEIKNAGHKLKEIRHD